MTNDSGLRPIEYNVVVKPDPVEEKTAGGIIIPINKTERDKLAIDEGTLVAVSPHAFSYADWPEGEEPPKPGARVMFARYAGSLHERNGVEYRILKDKDLVAVVESLPEAQPGREKLSIKAA